MNRFEAEHFTTLSQSVKQEDTFESLSCLCPSESNISFGAAGQPSIRMKMEIANKVIVVTGGIGGIGFQTVENFLRKNAKFVAVLDCVDSEVANSRLKILEKEFENERFGYFNCNVINPDNFRAIFEKIIQSHSYVDVLINNAGTACEKDVDLVINVNFRAVVKCTLTALDYMDKRKGGHGGAIVNIGSFLGIINDPLAPLYSATKHAVVAFVKGMKAHNKTLGVRILCICPGMTSTAMITPENLRSSVLDYDHVDSIDQYLQVYTQKPDNVAAAITEIVERGEDGAVWVAQNDEAPFAVKDVKTVEEMKIENR